MKVTGTALAIDKGMTRSGFAALVIVFGLGSLLISPGTAPPPSAAGHAWAQATYVDDAAGSALPRSTSPRTFGHPQRVILVILVGLMAITLTFAAFTVVHALRDSHHPRRR